MEILAQIFGLLAVIANVCSLQLNNREKLIRMQVMSSSMWTLHFALIGAFTGSYINAIGIARGIVFYEKHDRHWAKNKIWLYVFIIAFIAAGALTYKNVYSILPVAGTIIFTLLIWQNEVKNIRYGYIAVALLWLVYNFTAGSIFGIISELMLIASNVISVIRFDIIGHEKKHVEMHD